MLKSFFLLPLSVIPVVAPLRAPSSDIQPGSTVQIAKVPLPQLSPKQWKMLRQRQGAYNQALHIDVKLGVDRSKVYDVSVLRGTGYPDIDQAIVDWIAANWKTAPWFVGGDGYAVSFYVYPALRKVVFRNT